MSGSDLHAYAAHCRQMASAKHRPDCPPGHRRRRWINEFGDDGIITGGHTQPPACAGCVTDEDRARWAMLAAEAEAYLRREPEPTLL